MSTTQGANTMQTITHYDSEGFRDGRTEIAPDGTIYHYNSVWSLDGHFEGDHLALTIRPEGVTPAMQAAQADTYEARRQARAAR